MRTGEASEVDTVTNATSERSWWRRLITGSLLWETILVIGFAVIADLVVLMVDRPPIRAVFGFPLLLFFPGYAILTVLFPGQPRRSRYNTFDPLSRSISGVERVALSFGISLALIPPIALVFWTVNDQGFGVRAILWVFTAIITLGMIYGTYRRFRLPMRDRYRIPVSHWMSELRTNGFSGGVIGTLLRIGLAISVILAVGTLGYAVLVPNQSASYTNTSLLTRGPTGDLTAANYSNAMAENGGNLILSIENNEKESVSYTVVVKIQRVETNGQQTSVNSSDELKRLQTTVVDGETDYLSHTVSPSMNGENLRLQYLIYKGDPPAVTTASNAYQTLFIWVDNPSPTATNPTGGSGTGSGTGTGSGPGSGSGTGQSLANTSPTRIAVVD